MTPNRDNDIIIAGMLGLKVLGEAPCYRSRITSKWHVSHDDVQDESQPVYLDHCFCDDPLEDEILVLGHVVSCLAVVPFYHKSDTLARQALEQICDERKGEHKLFPRLHRWSTGEWIVKIYKIYSNAMVAHASDKVFALAICKALVGVGEKR